MVLNVQIIHWTCIDRSRTVANRQSLHNNRSACPLFTAVYPHGRHFVGYENTRLRTNYSGLQDYASPVLQ